MVQPNYLRYLQDDPSTVSTSSPVKLDPPSTRGIAIAGLVIAIFAVVSVYFWVFFYRYGDPKTHSEQNMKRYVKQAIAESAPGKHPPCTVTNGNGVCITDMAYSKKSGYNRYCVTGNKVCGIGKHGRTPEQVLADKEQLADYIVCDPGYQPYIDTTKQKPQDDFYTLECKKVDEKKCIPVGQKCGQGDTCCGSTQCVKGNCQQIM